MRVTSKRKWFTFFNHFPRRTSSLRDGRSGQAGTWRNGLHRPRQKYQVILESFLPEEWPVHHRDIFPDVFICLPSFHPVLNGAIGGRVCDLRRLPKNITIFGFFVDRSHLEGLESPFQLQPFYCQLVWINLGTLGYASHTHTQKTASRADCLGRFFSFL